MTAANSSSYPSDFEVRPLPSERNVQFPQIEVLTAETLPLLATCANIIADTHRNDDMRCLARTITRLCAHITYREAIHQEYKKAVFESHVPQPPVSS